MGAVYGGGSEQRPWSDLPGDLLSAIYLGSTSAYDRARFAAVCSAWRAAAAWHLRLPALPLLLMSTGDGKRAQEARAYSPEDRRSLRVPLPWFPPRNRLVGSYQGGWIATLSGSDGLLLIVNIVSGARAARLSIDNITFIRKVVFSKDPSSPGCIVAALAYGCTVAVRRVGSPDHRRWTTWTGRNMGNRDLLDIAFCNESLCGVTCRELFVVEVGLDKQGAVVTISSSPVDVEMPSFYTAELFSSLKYIFALHDKLAIAVEAVPRGDDNKTCHFFWVFELTAIDTATSSHKFTWTEVTTLGDHALFLGSAICKTAHISTAGRRGGVEGNRIYYYKEDTYLHNSLVCVATRCTLHCGESKSQHHMERIVSQGYHYSKDLDGANGCVWIWPPDF